MSDLSDARRASSSSLIESWVKAAGLAFVKQRPGMASGVVFIGVADETGDFQIFVGPRLFEQNRRVIQRAKFIGGEGLIQKEGPIIHVMARSLYELSTGSGTRHLKVESHDFHYARCTSWRPS